ncbi:MAG: hypothetical protein U9M94_04350 [Patescibacteria group bacterium]|nr:hypothetical protein [Patescibacteria group bacterium]
MLKNILKNKLGTSLIEIMFAVSIFVILIGLTLGIFKSTIESQKNAIAAQNIQENLRFLFEIISKEIRGAKIMDSACDGFFTISSDKKIYYVNGGVLYFKNKDDECVAYYVDGNDDFVIERDNGIGALPITPNDIKVTDLDFFARDNDIGVLPDAKIQPRVTIKIEVEANNSGAYKQHTIMQTTVSSRRYE